MAFIAGESTGATGGLRARTACYVVRMCRSIKKLRKADEPTTEQEIQEAALQFVRKISGYRVPAQRNAEAFDSAVQEITEASSRLLDGLKSR